MASLLKGSSRPMEGSSRGKGWTRQPSLVPLKRKHPAENPKLPHLRSSWLPCGRWRRSRAISAGTGPWCRGPWTSASSWSASRPPRGQLGCCRGLPALGRVPPGRSAGERGGLSTRPCSPVRGKKKKPIHPVKRDLDPLKLLLPQASSKPRHCATTAAPSADYGR